MRIELELAQRRLEDNLSRGLMLQHNWILKECPGKNWDVSTWNQKTREMKYERAKFKFCTLCKKWFWSAQFPCPEAYQLALEEEIKILTNMGQDK